jgi:hypothetical protein
MKVAPPLLFLFGLLAGQCAHAEKADVQRPHWVIIATFIDRTTGRKLGQSPLRSPELEFADAVACKSVVDRVRPVESDHVTTVLTCRKVVPWARVLVEAAATPRRERDHARQMPRCPKLTLI